jgi:hypothetical protein
MSIEGLGNGEVKLDGPWQFHLGDNPAWAARDCDDTTGKNGWEQIKADSTWGEQTHPGYTGFAWYRKHIRFTSAPGVNDEIALLTGGVESASEVYWNGTLVGRNGKLPPNPRWDTVQRSQIVHLGSEREGVLAFRVWLGPLDSSDFNTRLGGFENPPRLGALGVLENFRTVEVLFDSRYRLVSICIGVLFGLIGIFCLVGWARNRKQTILFWLGLYALFGLAQTILDPNIGSFQRVHIQESFLQLGAIAEWFFLIYLLKLEDKPWLIQTARVLSVILIIASIIDAILVVPDLGAPGATSWYVWTDSVLNHISSLLDFFPLVSIFLALRRRLGVARWLIAGAVLLMQLTVVYGWAIWLVIRYSHWNLPDNLWNPVVLQLWEFPLFLRDIPRLLLAAALIYSYYRSTHESNAEQQRLEQELRSARELQKVLIPETMPTLAGYELTSAYRPAQEVGGDFFQIVPLEDTVRQATLIVLGDVSGKGLKAAMAVSLIVGMVRALARFIPAPGAFLTEVNQRLAGRLQGGFATCLALMVDAEGTCVLASAGHPAPIHNGQEVDLPGALPLGLTPTAAYEVTTIHLRVGDHLAFYTDGLLEARRASGELFGFDRLRTLFLSRPDAAKATEAAVQFGQDDDITVLVLTRLATGLESTSTVSVPALETSDA